MKVLICILLLGLIGCATPPPHKSLWSESEVKTSIRNNLKENNIESIPLIISKRFNEAITDYHADQEDEQHLSWNIYAFYHSREDLEQPLNEFVASAPENEVGYIYRAAYFYGKGYRARGTAYISQTSKDQLDRMRFYYAQALSDLDTVKRINPNNIYAYILSLEVKRFSREAEQSFNMDLKKALELDPSNYDLWQNILTVSLPRWGGTHDIMRNELNKMSAYYEVNPRLKDLSSAIDVDITFLKAQAENNNVKIEMYRNLVQQGATPRVLDDYAYYLSRANKWKEACEVTQQVISKLPFSWYGNLRSVECANHFLRTNGTQSITISTSPIIF